MTWQFGIFEHNALLRKEALFNENIIETELPPV